MALGCTLIALAAPGLGQESMRELLMQERFHIDLEKDRDAVRDLPFDTDSDTTIQIANTRALPQRPGRRRGRAEPGAGAPPRDVAASSAS